MTARHDATASELGFARRCGSYRPGHEVHYIQARKSREAGPGTSATVTAVDDDGTIHFADGTTKWHHEPRRLGRALELGGTGVQLCPFGLLRVPNGDGAHIFCVGDEPSPCPGPAAPPETLEDLVTQIEERRGFLLPGVDVLRLVEEWRARRGS